MYVLQSLHVYMYVQYVCMHSMYVLMYSMYYKMYLCMYVCMYVLFEFTNIRLIYIVITL